MTRALKGRPGRQIGPLKEKTVHAALTKQRIHAIVSQVIDELEKRRVAGKGDYVAKLADEVAEGGLAAWKSLRDLLPRDDPADAPSGLMNIGNLFVLAAQQAAERGRAQSAPMIDLTGEPVTMGASEDPVEW
jgi:hypothetical protein